MGVHKRFSPQLYKQYDTPGIEAVLAYLDDQGVFAKVGADKYGVDVVVYAGLRPCAYIEVEVVRAWQSGPSWPWPDCHVLERKGKWMRGQLGLPCTLYRLSADLSTAILVPDHTLADDQLQEIQNDLVPQGELMYVVPLDELEVVDLRIGRASEVYHAEVS